MSIKDFFEKNKKDNIVVMNGIYSLIQKDEFIVLTDGEKEYYLKSEASIYLLNGILKIWENGISDLYDDLYRPSQLFI